MATITSRGKKRIMSNNGHLKVDIGGNNMTVYDGVDARFIAGDKQTGETKVQMTLPGVSVL